MLTLRQVNEFILAGRFSEARSVLCALESTNPELTDLYAQKVREIESAVARNVGSTISHQVPEFERALPLVANGGLHSIIFLTASCHVNYAKRHSIEATWGASLRSAGVRHFFVVGSPEIAYACRLGQLLFVPCRDDYESLLLKLALAYEYLLSHESGFTHVFKIDDDCYLNLPRFEKDLGCVDLTADYIAGMVQPVDERINRRWHFGKCGDSRFDQPYPYDYPPAQYAKGGYGYLLSRRAMGVIVREIPTFRVELDNFVYSYEDLRIGHLMSDAGISITKLPNYEVAPPGSPSILGKSIVFDITYLADFQRYHHELGVWQLRHGSADQFLRMVSERIFTVQERLGFDHVYVVNLRSALDRRVKTQWTLYRHGIEHELCSAFDGQSPVGQGIFQLINDRAIGDLAAHPQFADLEKWRGAKFIESLGAVGYILTYVRLLRDAKVRGFRRILILEDDVLLRDDFLAHLAQFVSRVGSDWKVLQLGASQYGWESVDLLQAERQGFYHPRPLDTCGSFAIGIDLHIVDELIRELLSFDGPFDHIPLGQIYERYPNDCYVAYPNIVIADVSESFIRGGRDQRSHSVKMGWPLEHFGFPQQRVRIGVVLRQGGQLRSYPPAEYGVDMFCYRVTVDGLRPVHDLTESATAVDSLSPEEEAHWLDRLHTLPVDKLFAVSRTCDGGEIVLEALDTSSRFGAGVGDSRSREWLRPIQNQTRADRRGRAAVVITTRGRKEALVHAIASVLDQDWPDKEVIVVDDNDPGSDIANFVSEHLQVLQKGGAPVRLIKHAYPRNAAAARNTGLLATHAEFVSFLDDDDAYLPGRLRHVIEVLASSPPQVGGAYCGYLGWSSKVNNPARYPTDHIPRRMLNLEFQSHYVCTDTVTYRRQALLSVNGYDESFWRHQDLELNIRVFRRWEIVSYPDVLVQLNPLPPDNSNKLFDANLFNTKLRFLQKFEAEICALDLDYEEILKAHVREIVNFTRNPDEVRDFALSHPSHLSSTYLQMTYFG